MQILKQHQPPSSSQNPLSFIKKQIDTIKFSQNNLYAARSISSQYCILFYEHNALVIDVKTEEVVQDIVYPLIQENRKVHGEKFLQIEGGFVIEVDHCHVYQNGKYSIIRPESKGTTYFSKMYFPDTGLFCIPFFLQGYYHYGNTSEAATLYTQNGEINTFTISRNYKQADDSSLILTRVNKEQGTWVFLDIKTQQLQTLPLPEFVKNERQIQSLSICQKSKGLIIINQSENVYAMHWFDVEKKPQLQKQLLRYRKCKSMKLLRRKNGLVLIFVNYFDEHQWKNISRNILYSMKYKQIIWQKDLVDGLVKGSIWQNYFSHGLDSFVEHVRNQKFSNTKITCYQGIKKKRVYIDLITKSGIRELFGDVIVKEAVKVLSEE